ncbi:MAG: hypothetical protein KKA42_01530 [candidate division Zixibacteria bacterium]|nr:hypothetical protein [candidate division Zixibacteria bacterium]
MAKKQTFLDKTVAKGAGSVCPVCKGEVSYVKQVKAVKSDVGSWKFRTNSIPVCKCNENEVYA